MKAEEAAKALDDARVTAARSAAAARYERLSANLLIWGAVWLLLNIAGLLRAPHGGVLFPLLMFSGFAASLIVAMRGAPSSARRDHLLRTLAVGAGVLLFVLGMMVISPTGSLVEVEAIICLASGAAYVATGANLGWRLSAIGFAQLAGTILGWIYARDQFFLWMAIFGGGGLILGGLWLRRV